MTAAVLKRMRTPGSRPRAGAHDSSAMHVDTPWHKHDLHQLIYAFEGGIEVESPHARYLAPPQLAAFIPAGLPHRTRIQGKRSGSIFLPTAWIGPAGPHIRVLRASPLMREMVKEAMRWPIDQPEDEAGRAVFKAFASLCREWLDKEAPFHLPTSDDPRLQKALDYTAANPNARFAEVCRATGASERSLRRKFIEQIGMSWTDYRHRSRLIKAMALLESRRPIGAIAASIGFESASAFSKAFRAFAGESPRTYRNRVCP